MRDVRLWLEGTAVDECVTSNGSGGGVDDYVFFPPCNWVAEAGVARQGPRAGDPRYDVCLDLYACIMRTGCGAGGPAAACLCGASSTLCDGGGPCGSEELAALEERVDTIQDALKNYTDDVHTFAGYGGSALNYVFQIGKSNACFDAGAQ